MPLGQKHAIHPVRTISKKTAVPKKAQRPIVAARNSPPKSAAKTIGQGAVTVEINAGIALPSGSLPAQIGLAKRLSNTAGKTRYRPLR